MTRHLLLLLQFNNIDDHRNRRGDFCADTPVELVSDDGITPGHCTTPQVADPVCGLGGSWNDNDPDDKYCTCYEGCTSPTGACIGDSSVLCFGAFWSFAPACATASYLLQGHPVNMPLLKPARLSLHNSPALACMLKVVQSTEDRLLATMRRLRVHDPHQAHHLRRDHAHQTEQGTVLPGAAWYLHLCARLW